MGFNYLNILIATFIGIIFMLSIAPGIGRFSNSTFSQSLNNSGLQTQSAISSNVVTPLQNTTLSAKNGSFFAQTQQFTGYAFVLPNFGVIMNSLLNAPRILSYGLSTGLSVIPQPDNVGSQIIPLFLSFGLIFVISIGISEWMKGDLLRMGGD